MRIWEKDNENLKSEEVFILPPTEQGRRWQPQFTAQQGTLEIDWYEEIETE